jgi:hypothetical protein
MQTGLTRLLNSRWMAPFAAGSRGTTRLPGQDPLLWLIQEVVAPADATFQTV